MAGPSTTLSIAPKIYPILEKSFVYPTPLGISTRDSKQNPRYANSTSSTFALLVSDSTFFKDVEKEDKWDQMCVLK